MLSSLRTLALCFAVAVWLTPAGLQAAEPADATTVAELAAML